MECEVYNSVFSLMSAQPRWTFSLNSLCIFHNFLSLKIFCRKDHGIYVCISFAGKIWPNPYTAGLVLIGPHKWMEWIKYVVWIFIFTSLYTEYIFLWLRMGGGGRSQGENSIGDAICNKYRRHTFDTDMLKRKDCCHLRCFISLWATFLGKSPGLFAVEFLSWWWSPG